MLKRNQFTLIELLIAISLSLVVFSMMMVTMLQVSSLTRDIMADFTLNNYARLARYQLLRGNAECGGIGLAEDFKVNGDAVSYRTYSGAYPFEKEESSYTDVSLSLTDQLEMSSEGFAETLLMPRVTVGEKQTSAYTQNDDKDIFVNLRIERDYMGETYAIEQVIRATPFQMPEEEE